MVHGFLFVYLLPSSFFVCVMRLNVLSRSLWSSTRVFSLMDLRISSCSRVVETDALDVVMSWGSQEVVPGGSALRRETRVRSADSLCCHNF